MKTHTKSPIPADARGVRKVAFHALGTPCAIHFRMEDEQSALLFMNEALAWLSAFQNKYSRFQKDSLTSRINQSAGLNWVNIDNAMGHMLDTADDLYRLTDGILDPTMLPLLRVWDWKILHTSIPAESDISAARRLVGWDLVQRKPGRVFLPQQGMGLDFGGFGKEYAVDEIVKIARKHLISDALIDLGRDVYGMGGNGVHPFWHVGLEDGANPGSCWGGLAVSGFAVCSSGDYARRFEYQGKRFGHIIDPRTGWPVSNGMCAVSVCAPTCLQAGVYSTALFVMGRDQGMQFATCARSVDVSMQDASGFERSPGFVRRQVQAA